MKWRVISFLLISFCWTEATAQFERMAARYYFATGDYMQDNLSMDEIILEVKTKGSDFIHAKKVLDPVTGKPSARGKIAWAISYDGQPYMHLMYSYNSAAPNLFIKMDVKGRFCLAVMEPDFMNSMSATRSGSYGGGAMGALISDSGTWGGTYIDQEGNKKKIFIIDTKDRSMVRPHKAENAPAELLTRDTLKWLVGKENFRGAVSAYSVEEVVAIVEDLNRRQKTKTY